MREDLLHQVALSMIPGIGRVTMRHLISYCGSAQQVFRSNLHKLSSVPGVGDKTAQLVLNSETLDQADCEIRTAEKLGVSLLFYTDRRFPNRLKALDDAPLLLYTKGKKALNNTRTLGIVGTRRATSYGRTIIPSILEKLQIYRPTVISGLAYGIDVCAHREALKLGLPTIGVLGNSLDRIYPSQHQNTAQQMLEQGALVSELKFGTQPESYHFPSRNRIIAGLSDALLIVEAQEKGGALITASIMNQYQRPVFAIPGPIDAPSSMGCNQLIKKQEATMLTSEKDILAALGWTAEAGPPPAAAFRERSVPEQGVISVLKAHPEGVHIDDLSWKTQIPINKMGSLLLTLEFDGLIKALPGKKFLLVSK